MLPKIFLFYLVDTQTGNCYYVDSNGNVQKASIQSGVDVSLGNAPDGWLNIELSFIRNSTYYGINRSFSQPMKFVNDAAKIIRSLIYPGKGIETPLTLIILKYNDLPQSGEPLYQLYYRGQLDLSKATDFIAEGFQANLMEGGALQLLKTYENMVFEIPCDGSIPQNVKANLDGMLIPNVEHYEILFAQTGAGELTIPCTLISQDGDSYGIVSNNPSLSGQSPTDFISSGLNYLSQSTAAIEMTVEGTVTVRPYSGAHADSPFYVYLMSDQYPTKPIQIISPKVTVNQQQVVSFSGTYQLAAGEKMYLCYSHSNTLNPMAITGGKFDLSYSSMAQATAPWCLSLYDAFVLLVQYICAASKTTDLQLNYGAVSTLLQNNLNLLITSGDALRASGDASYQKFFQVQQLNPNQPSSNLVTTFGPVIKTSLADLFKTVSVILFGALGNQQLSGQPETLFIESMNYVFGQDNTIDLGEVRNFKVSPAGDKMFNAIKIGYPEQQDDQKNGKYEYNTAAEWIAPIKTMQRKLELVSKYNASPYIIERLRANISGVSTTRNSNDNSVHIINVDRSQQTLDSQLASFLSQVNDVNNANNTNIRLLANYCAQGLCMATVDGTYLSMLNDAGIFAFSNIISPNSQPLAFSFSGTLQGNPANALTGLPADYITIVLMVQGIKVYSRTFTASGPDTPFSDTFDMTGYFSQGDVIYAYAITSVNGSTNNMQASLLVGASGAYFSANGTAIEVNAGTAFQIIDMPNISNPLVGGVPVVSFGFQYFLFNSILINSEFNIAFQSTAVLQNGAGGQLKYLLYKNGSLVKSVAVPSSNQNPVSTTIADQQDFQIGDIYFVLVSSLGCWSQIQNASLQFISTTITKYALKRIQYDVLDGVPNTLPTTTQSGAPYNIEDLSPKRLFNKWASWFASGLDGQIPGTIYFSTLTKNQYLVTTANGLTVKENADVQVHDLGDPLWLPYYLEGDFKIPLTFSQLLTGLPNALVKFTANGIPFYGFIEELKQKPALNEVQTVKLICSPLTDLLYLMNFDYDGQNFINMPPNSLYAAFLLGLQTVPEGVVLPAKYHTKDMNMSWFSEQVYKWINQNNYWQPVQIGDIIPIQVQTNGLAPVTVYLYSSAGAIVQTVTLTQKTSNGLVGSNLLWEGEIDTTDVPAGSYYIYINAGGSGGANRISEGILLSENCYDTLLFEYSNSVNKQAMIFDTGFTASMRVKGFFDNRLKPKYTGAFYEDQQMDIEILNAFPYETRELWIGLDDGVPDYVIQKLSRIMLLDTVFIEGIQYSLDKGAEWEEDFIPGNPKKYWKTIIRRAQNIDGTISTAAGVSGDTSMVVTVDANAFGPNANNASDIANAEIIEITVS